MENTATFADKWSGFMDKIRPGMQATGRVFSLIGAWIFRLRKVLLSVPVLVTAFYLAVQSRDIKVLTKLPGIGKKPAERLLLELKDKVGPVAAESADSFGEAVAAGGSGAVAEAIEALASLGYSNSEIMPVIKKIEGAETKTSEEILKQALRLMMK